MIWLLVVMSLQGTCWSIAHIMHSKATNQCQQAKNVQKNYEANCFLCPYTPMRILFCAVIIMHACICIVSYMYLHTHTHTHTWCLQTSGDVVVLSNALFVVSAILPMVPSYIGGHLHDIFTIFCELATIRTTNRLGKK